MVENGTYSDEQVDILRRTPIEEVLRARGFNTKHTRASLYHSPFREDKTASFHIDPAKNVWSDPGDQDPAHFKKNRDGSLKKQAGGDVIDLVMFLDGVTFRKALDYLASFNPGIVPVRGGMTRNAPASFNADGALAGYACHSGGALGADSYWGEAGARLGVAANHYWHGKKTPNGNVEVTEEQFREGVGMVNRANRRLHRNPDKYMDLLARNWMQVREAEAVYAVGRFAESPIRIGREAAMGYRGVDGGTGWAAQMAADSGKPLYLFDQVSCRWYRFKGPDRAFDGWEPLPGAPALTKDFAGIGTRKLTEDGRLAIREAYSATLRQVRGLSEAAAGKAPEQDDYMSRVDMTSRMNIYFGTGENASLSNMAERPFTVGLNRFRCVEQWFQWSKAVFAGDAEIASAILSADDPKQAKSLGRQVRGLDSAAWDAVAPQVMEQGIRLSFVANPSAQAELLRTGSAFLTHEQDRGRWGTEFPRILMKVRAEMLSQIVDDNGVYVGASTIDIRSFERGPRMASLRDYFTDVRKISPETLSKYAFEVKYNVIHNDTGEVSARQYAAVGFPNVSGQWALRGAPYRERNGEMNGGIKRSTGGDFTAIDREGNLMFREGVDGIVPGAPSLRRTADFVVVFEGFTDFMSWMDWNGKAVPGNTDVVILNSTSNTPSAMDFIVSHPKVIAYLDNDDAGRQRTDQIREKAAVAGVQFRDCAFAYAPHNDLNAAWMQEVARREKKTQNQEQKPASERKVTHKPS